MLQIDTSYRPPYLVQKQSEDHVLLDQHSIHSKADKTLKSGLFNVGKELFRVKIFQDGKHREDFDLNSKEWKEVVKKTAVILAKHALLKTDTPFKTASISLKSLVVESKEIKHGEKCIEDTSKDIKELINYLESARAPKKENMARFSKMPPSEPIEDRVITYDFSGPIKRKSQKIHVEESLDFDCTAIQETSKKSEEVADHSTKLAKYQPDTSYTVVIDNAKTIDKLANLQIPADSFLNEKGAIELVF